MVILQSIIFTQEFHVFLVTEFGGSTVYVLSWIGLCPFSFNDYYYRGFSYAITTLLISLRKSRDVVVINEHSLDLVVEVAGVIFFLGCREWDRRLEKQLHRSKIPGLCSWLIQPYTVL